METWDITESLPFNLSEDIFLLLDIPSLCSASEVSTQWNHCINESDYVWKRKFLSLNSCLSGSKKVETLQWKEMAIREYYIQQYKSAWLRGQFSLINCYKDLRKCTEYIQVQKLTTNDWGEIFQRELDR
ncbi:F-box only protein 48-like [Styela clava]